MLSAGPDASPYLYSLLDRGLARLSLARRDFAGAVKLALRALGRLADADREPPDTMNLQLTLAEACNERGDFDAARAAAEHALPIALEILGDLPHSLHVGQARLELGVALAGQGPCRRGSRRAPEGARAPARQRGPRCRVDEARPGASLPPVAGPVGSGAPFAIYWRIGFPAHSTSSACPPGRAPTRARRSAWRKPTRRNRSPPGRRRPARAERGRAGGAPRPHRERKSAVVIDITAFTPNPAVADTDTGKDRLAKGEAFRAQYLGAT